MKKVQILLSRHTDLVSNLIYWVTGRKFTHASIGLEEDPHTFYSFNFKGFRIEKPARWKTREQLVVYEIGVSYKEYEIMKHKIHDMKKEQDKYSYNLLGIILCILHISSNIKFKYFCSQFVAELLVDARIVSKKVNPSLCLPNTFINLLEEIHRCHKKPFPLESLPAIG